MGEIQHLFEEVTDHYVNNEFQQTSMRYTIETRSGERYVFGDELEMIGGLGLILTQETQARVIPRARNAIEDGGAVAFGPLTIRSTGLLMGASTLPWAEIERVVVEEGHLVVRRRGKLTAWARLGLSKVPHAQAAALLLGECLDRHRGIPVRAPSTRAKAVEVVAPRRAAPKRPPPGPDSPGLAPLGSPPGEAILFLLLPLDHEPGRDQIQRLGSLLRLQPYDARLCLTGQLPQVLSAGPGERQRELAEALGAAGLPTVLVDRSLAQGTGLLDVVPEALEGELLHLRGVKALTLDLSQPTLLIKGRMIVSSQAVSSGRKGKGGFQKTIRTELTEFRPFAHLYLADGTAPLNLPFLQIPDYEFLPAPAPSLRDKFHLLVELIAQGSGVSQEEVVETLVSRASTATALLWSASDPSHTDEMRTEWGCQLISHVLFERWRSTLAL